VLFAPQPAGGGALPPGADKLVHATLFAVLAGTALARFGRPAPVLVSVLCYASASELVQALFLPTRSGDVRDAVADAVGVGLGWLAARRLLGRQR
jgi:VanZ family protein